MNQVILHATFAFHTSSDSIGSSKIPKSKGHKTGEVMLVLEFHNEEKIYIHMALECPESNNSWKEKITALKGIINNDVPLTVELCIQFAELI